MLNLFVPAAGGADAGIVRGTAGMPWEYAEQRRGNQSFGGLMVYPDQLMAHFVQQHFAGPGKLSPLSPVGKGSLSGENRQNPAQ
jgi:hypothetical protein